MKKNLKQNLKNAYPKNINKIIELISSVADKRKVKAFMVGGVVRDLLLNNPSVDLDITLEGISGVEFAEIIADSLGASFKTYPQFNTSTIKTKDAVKIDIATCRKELYLKPGILPEVKSSDIKEDLKRRDFTINAIAISLNSKTFADVVDYYGGYPDLENHLIRIMHDNSFNDDPTRILRAIRFAARLNFNFDTDTKVLLNKAIKEKKLNSVSKNRIRQELRLILSEEDCFAQIKKLDEYINLDFIHPNLKISSSMDRSFSQARDYLLRFIKESNIKDLSKDARWIVNFMILIDDLKQDEMESILEDFNFTNSIKNKVIKYKKFSAQVSKLLGQADKLKASHVYGILNPLCLEASFAIISRTDKICVKDKIWSFIVKDRLIKIKVTGDDLKDMGITPGPKFDFILTRLLYAKIDKDIINKEDELKLIKKLI